MRGRACRHTVDDHTSHGRGWRSEQLAPVATCGSPQEAAAQGAIPPVLRAQVPVNVSVMPGNQHASLTSKPSYKGSTPWLMVNLAALIETAPLVDLPHSPLQEGVPAMFK